MQFDDFAFLLDLKKPWRTELCSTSPDAESTRFLMRLRMTQSLILPDCPSAGMVGVTDLVKCAISLSGNCPRFTPARLTPRSFNSG